MNINKKVQFFLGGPTWGEINFFAYDYPTVEFHNELYGYLQELSKKSKCKEFDEFLTKNHGIPNDKEWIPERNGQAQSREYVTLMTFIRHKIHHPDNKTMQSNNYTPDELKESIQKMIEILNKLTNKQTNK